MIDGYDLADPADRIIPFDYDHTGKLDHLLLYRPGFGTVWILKNNNGTFSPVFAEGSPGNGIDGYDLADPADRIIPFDYDHTGKLDHLLLYRPGIGTAFILRNLAGSFSPVFANAPTPLQSTFVGTATLVTNSTDPRLATPPAAGITCGFEFSADRSAVRIVNLSPIVIGPITGLPIVGSVTVTITRIPGEGPGTFDVTTGSMTLPIGLHFAYDKHIPVLLGDSDAAFGFPSGSPMTTASAISPGGSLTGTGSPRNLATGAITLVGASRFTGGAPLSGLDCLLSLTGTMTPTA
jgi:hypothetical protein